MVSNSNSTQQIKKLHLEAMVLFAINNVPQADSETLKRFLELVNANGSFGSISHDQILTKMNQVIKYIPGACANSLIILMDLLEIKSRPQLSLNASRRQASHHNKKGEMTMPFIIDAPSAVTFVER